MDRPLDRKPALPLLARFAILALLVGTFAVSCGGTAAEQRAENGPQGGSGEEQASADLEHPSLGDENAPVVLTEYADYQ